MRIAYFDCFSGISGDMVLGALLDAGLSETALLEGLAAMKLPEYVLSSKRVIKHGIAATKATVDAQEGHVHRGLTDIVKIIEAGDLPEEVKRKSIAVFEVLAVAEAQIHGTSKEDVHFHEVGAVDAIVDIVGACLGLHLLGIEKVYCSPLPTGSGQVKSAHGIIPVPAPATLALLAGRQVPVYDNAVRGELVTPTGAALMVGLAEEFGGFPAMHVTSVGYGAGQKDFSIANVLRVVVGEGLSQPPQRSQHRHSHSHGEHRHNPHQPEHDHTH